MMCDLFPFPSCLFSPSCLFLQEDCKCVCSVETGSRLTCITVSWPGKVPENSKVDQIKTGSKKRKLGTEENEKTVAAEDRKVKKVKKKT